MIGMLGASMKAAISDVIESTVTSDYVVAGPSSGQFPLPQGVIDDVSKVDGVNQVVVIGAAPVKIAGQQTAGFGVPLTAYGQGDMAAAVKAENVHGSLDLRKPGFIADTKIAAAKGWRIGDTVPLSTDELGEFGTATLLGTYDPLQTLGPAVVSYESLKPLVDAGAVGPQRGMSPYLAFVDTQEANGTPGGKETRDRLSRAVEPYIVAQVQTPTEYAGSQAVTVDQMLNTLYGLLGLAVVIAILGIVNTLALNVIERRQEVGMLRAVGTQRRQIRTMITLEAVQIAIYGALMGVAIGLIVGWAFLKVLRGEGISVIAVPWSQIVAMVAGSGVVGVIAALWPSVKASRTPPLAAIGE
ncbi:ABC transporter permease YtrF precursor [Corynebacterium heidelbergense]|nr:ABC transporter permease YtrF precursor [Corynebacterium heidelbergense]